MLSQFSIELSNVNRILDQANLNKPEEVNRLKEAVGDLFWQTWTTAQDAETAGSLARDLEPLTDRLRELGLPELQERKIGRAHV